MAQYNHHLKRLINTFDSRKSLPNDELIRKSIQSFTISAKNSMKFYRSVELLFDD
jgi:hypothetical protein